ncbi:ComEC family competence protein [Niastella sp. MAH-29]|uniref:ComEC family competence protein n=2 Tax=Chitinophagaceae TaxID=563835 RepID=A0ABS3YMW3_9BACT|nr:ComEC/Rec2 family competence protein [Niastella soli]MBO9199234.1 ComEC family competence protein [Niastella soli]
MWLFFALPIVARWFFYTQPLSRQYRAQWLNGIFLHATLFATGGLVLFYGDIQHQKTSITRQNTAGKVILVTIEEPLSEKKQSYKTIASVQAVLFNHALTKVSGKILLYFQKDSTIQQLHYGKQLLLYKPLQPVKNTGNPGCFDYQRYCTFQGISHQVYLKQGEYVPLKIKNENLFRKYLFSTRAQIVALLKKYIPGTKEAGLAEAMLIGYKEDLDQHLVQSYTDTGVVHIIAISGLHLGLIYWLLMLLCKPLASRPGGKLLQPLVIVAGLWLFSCIAGNSPSVLRSAVMFTCLVIGAHLNRKTSIYNSLAASAFLLLCYNPFWLWDAGFQLSYAAVLSLAIFYKPIYNLLYVPNKVLNLLWKSVSVTLAAQILTVPVSVYHFHQFPNLFLIANLLAVPLSSLIIIGEIILCVAGLFPLIASGIGYLLQHTISWLNTFIEWVGSLPYATMGNLQINGPQLVCFYLLIIAMAWWLLNNRNRGAVLSLLSLLFFIVFRTVEIWNTRQQKKLIVYNVPRHSAIDVMVGTKYFFKGDSLLQQDILLQKFHLQPCRLLHRVNNTFNPGNILGEKNFFRFGHTSFLVIDGPLDLSRFYPNTPVDIIILSNNSVIQIAEVSRVFTCRQFVFDASNAAWKVAKWQQECAQMGLGTFSVADKGAFVFNLY